MDLKNFKEFKDGANQIIDDLAQALNTQDQLADLITACDKQIDELVAKRDGYRNEMVEACEQFEHLVLVLEDLPKIIKSKLGMVDETDEDETDYDEMDRRLKKKRIKKNKKLNGEPIDDYDDDDDFDDDDDWDDEIDNDEDEEVDDDEVEPDGTL